MDRLIKTANLWGGVASGDNLISALAYVDDHVLFGNSAEELQNNIGYFEIKCTNFGTTISCTKIQDMHVG